jgi:hypothetical protein
LATGRHDGWTPLGAEATMGMERFFEAGAGAKAV